MRTSGILLHPTSLPGRFGIGDLGAPAYRFVDFLMESGQGLWQVLPLGPPGYGNSPYQSHSSMGGNPLLLSLEMLIREGCLSSRDLEDAPAFPASFVDYERVIPFKWKILRRAARNFLRQPSGPLHDEFNEFCEIKKTWLESYAEFAALRAANGGSQWTGWQRCSNPDPEEVKIQKFVQFEFFRQWRALKSYCNERGVRIVGDLPIFVSHDSADVWANPELYDLDENGQPNTIAGVPPDYFSETGQCWGNPLYRWDVMAATGYLWWIDRVRAALEQVDLIRLDHFRGFEKYFEIPGDATTAENGRWIEGPGDAFFQALQDALGQLPFIAEDLGYITSEVLALRDRWGLPGMRVLQFAFGNDSPEDPFKPHNFIPHCVVYTGTHDNDTTVGWFNDVKSKSNTLTADQARAERELALRYLNSDGTEIHWDFIRAAVSSVAETAMFPLQDVLGLGSEARMNLPARAKENWRWRFEESQLTPDLSSRLRELNRLYGRLPR
jgi:4-alpha-glucanotransferase